MSDQQIIKDGDHSPSTEKPSRKRPGKAQTECVKASALFAKVLNMGSTPVNPAEYLRILIGRVQIPSRDEASTISVHQFIEELKEFGVSTDIETTDQISSLILAIESEYNAEIKTICSALLYLVSKSKNSDRRLEVDNLIWGFAVTDKREDFVETVSARGSAPIYSKGEFPPINRLEFDSNDWTLFFKALISVLCRSSDPHSLFHSLRTEWQNVQQNDKIKSYLLEEAKAWSRLRAQCKIIGRQSPTEDDRMEKLFRGLTAESQKKLQDRLYKLPTNPNLEEFLSALIKIDEKNEHSLPWQIDTRHLSRCPHCLFPNPKHSPDECSKKDCSQRSEERKNVTWQKKSAIKQTFHIETAENPDLSVDSVSFSMVHKEGLFTAIMKTESGENVVVGFDTCSTISLISPDARMISVAPTNPVMVQGFGGTQCLSGARAKMFLNFNGRRFNVAGYVGPTPKNIDLLVGIPQLRNMGLVIDFSSDQPVATITKLDNLRIPLLSGNNNPAVLHMHDGLQDMKLPELCITVDPQVTKVPYQHPTGYPLPPKYKEAAYSAINHEIAQGHLTEIEWSPDIWISPLFTKVKADGSVRLLADLKVLNRHIVNPDYWASMGPNRGTFLSAFSGSFFSKIDISAAFHSCPVEPGCRNLLVVRFDGKLYRYNTAPQGLSTSALFFPLHLKAGFDQLLGSDWTNWAQVYVDDILIAADDAITCQSRTELVMWALQSMGKNISPKSVTSPQSQIECIGLKFSMSGWSLSDQAVNKLKQCFVCLPRTAKEMRSLIGAVQYARSAIDLAPSRVGQLLGSLNDTIRRKQFAPTPAAEAALAEIRENIKPKTFVPFNPRHPDIGPPHWIVVTDASDYGCGAVLYKTSLPPRIGLENDLSVRIEASDMVDLDIHALSPAEQKWLTFEKENYAIFRAASRWRNILVLTTGSITFATDSNTALGQWESGDVKPSTSRNRRFLAWALEVAYLDCCEVHFTRIAGSENSLADRFSRIAGSPLIIDEEVWVAHHNELPTLLTTQVQDAQNAEDIPLDQRSKDGKLIVPPSCLRRIIEQIHKSFHYGRRETMFHFGAHFASKEAHKVVAEVCSSCDCYAAKATRRDVQPMGTLKTDSLPFAEVCMDTVGPIKTNQNQAYIVTTLCRSTLYVTFSVVQDIQARTLVDTLNSVFYTYSFPTTLTCDNFPSHKSKTFVEFAQQHHIKIVYTPVFAPHRNGLLERQHRVLAEVLRFYLLSKGKNWASQIPKIQARINDRTIGTTDGHRRITPFRLVHGFSFRAAGMPPEAEPTGDYDDLMDTIHSIEMTDISARRFNSFAVGQRVLRYAPVVNLDQSSKLNTRFKPSTVRQVLGKVTFKCADDDGTTVICDGRSLRKIHSNTSTSDNAVGGAM